MLSGPEIILHVGHGKTGTSYLQSCFALSAEALIEKGVYYPGHWTDERAKRGYITSGNLAGVEQWHQAIMDAATTKPKFRKILFSNEALFAKILREPERIVEIEKSYPVKVVLFVRDPVDLLASSYNQNIKRAQYIGSITDYIANYSIFENVCKFITLAKQYGFDVTIVNYSRHVEDLATTFAEVALHGMDITLIEPNAKIVNRSLTPSELYLQKMFNMHFDGRSARFISDVLCNQLPNVDAEATLLTEDEYRALQDKVSGPVQMINAILPESEKLILKPADETITAPVGHGSTQHIFSDEQVEAIVRAISNEIATNAAKLASIDAHINGLVRIANRLSKGGKGTAQDSIAILEASKVIRPKGQVIHQLLADLKSIEMQSTGTILEQSGEGNVNP